MSDRIAPLKHGLRLVTTRATSRGLSLDIRVHGTPQKEPAVPPSDRREPEQNKPRRDDS